jgi:metal-sulfur cluster biosynthetic enzyme
MTQISQKDVEKALSELTHPEINFSLIDLGMIADVVCQENQVVLTLKIPSLQVPIKELLIQNVKQTLADLGEATDVKINEKQMTQEERERFMKMAKEGWKL